MKRSYLAMALLALAVGLVIAGCGGGGGSGSATSAGGEGGSETASGGGGSYGESEKPAGEASGSAETTAISVGMASGVGQILVDSEGMTLYYFEKDGKGSGHSKCEGACASAWPPLTGGEGKAMSGVNASMLGTIERPDGTTQVTYAGWPLYTYVGDKAPGEDNGTDSKAFGASWYPLHPNGQKAGH